MKFEDERKQDWSGTGSGGAGMEIAASFAPAVLAGTVSSPLAALFDELSFGIAIVDLDGTLLHASRAARMQLQSRRALRLAGEVIEATFPEEATALQKALAGAATGRRSYLAFGRASDRIDVAVLPLDLLGSARPAAALVFEKSAGSGGLGLYFFAQAYRLTRSEQSVLTELSDGSSVIDAAGRLGTSVHTSRTHVRNILQKTGQQNLRALIRRVGMLPPVGARFAIAHARGEALGGAY